VYLKDKKSFFAQAANASRSKNAYLCAPREIKIAEFKITSFEHYNLSNSKTSWALLMSLI